MVTDFKGGNSGSENKCKKCTFINSLRKIFFIKMVISKNEKLARKVCDSRNEMWCDILSHFLKHTAKHREKEMKIVILNKWIASNENMCIKKLNAMWHFKPFPLTHSQTPSYVSYQSHS